MRRVSGARKSKPLASRVLLYPASDLSFVFKLRLWIHTFPSASSIPYIHTILCLPSIQYTRPYLSVHIFSFIFSKSVCTTLERYKMLLAKIILSSPPRLSSLLPFLPLRYRNFSSISTPPARGASPRLPPSPLHLPSVSPPCFASLCFANLAEARHLT